MLLKKYKCNGFYDILYDDIAFVFNAAHRLGR